MLDAGDGTTAGGGGSASEPSALDSGGEPGPPSAKQPPAEVQAPDPGGGAPAITIEPTGEAGAAGASVVTEPDPPSCGKETDGTLCGLNMTPAGAEGMRYFCSGGEIIAEARCPGTCDVETNACEQSGGTGGGSGETHLHLGLLCPLCYESVCRAELTICRGAPRCVAHLSCIETCKLDGDCFEICDSVFEDEPLFGALDECVERTGCAAFCAVQGDP